MIQLQIQSLRLSRLTPSHSRMTSHIRRCSTDEAKARATWRKSTNLGAFGSKSTRGSGISLMGGKRRGQGALTDAEKAALERGDFEDAGVDDELEAGDVLMEVLAEDHRFQRNRVEFMVEGDGSSRDRSGEDDDKGKELPPPSGPRVAHRQYLENSGVGPGTQFQRQQAAARQRVEQAQANAFSYRMPAEAKQQREHERRSRARLREHDVIENRIQVLPLTHAKTRPRTHIP